MTPEAAARRRELARLRQQRHRARVRAQLVAQLVDTPAAVPDPAPAPAGWRPDPPEPWWDRPEARPLREAWHGRGLRLPMTGGQVRLLARWARRGPAYVALCEGVRRAPRHGSTYHVVAAGLARALSALAMLGLARRGAWRPAVVHESLWSAPAAPVPGRPPEPDPSPPEPADAMAAWRQLGDRIRAERWASRRAWA